MYTPYIRQHFTRSFVIGLLPAKTTFTASVLCDMTASEDRETLIVSVSFLSGDPETSIPLGKKEFHGSYSEEFLTNILNLKGFVSCVLRDRFNFSFLNFSTIRLSRGSRTLNYSINGSGKSVTISLLDSSLTPIPVELPIGNTLLIGSDAKRRL